MAWVLLQDENEGQDKRVESVCIPCLDAGSNPASSTPHEPIGIADRIVVVNIGDGIYPTCQINIEKHILKSNSTMSDNAVLYSIGHGHKSQADFLAELHSFGITYLVDVRSSPYSKWSPEYFNQDHLRMWLPQEGITYDYMGNTIGGRPLNDRCYTTIKINGKEPVYLSYEKMAAESVFQAGLRRLVACFEEKSRQGIAIAIMCSETDPKQCHRSKLIGRELYFGYGINMHHLTKVGGFLTQEQVMMELEAKEGRTWTPAGDLFGLGSAPYFHSEKSYDINELP